MISRRRALSGAGLPLLRTAVAGAQSSRPLNLLFISCEDTSPTLGCYGDTYARTPNLDRLATQGARYSHAFSTYGVCAPSRSSIITAMYPTAIGTCHMRSQGVPPPEVKCFTEYLRAVGYYCTNNVKTDYNFESPATAWDESSPKAHWRNRPAGSPFFSVFNFVTTHESQIRAAPGVFARQTAALRPEDRHDPAQAPLPPYYPDTPVVRRDIANYYDLVTAMDLQAAAVLQQLDDDRLADNTVVFFWGDHGWGLTRGKRWVYDSGTRVPLIVRHPGRIQPGSVDRRLVSLMDLGPTVMSLAGINAPAYMHGQAFLGPHARPPRRYVYSARDRMDETYDIIRSVRDSRYRYIRNYQPQKPYAQYIHYMEQMPTLREMRRVYFEYMTAGTPKLTPAQLQYFQPEKPLEELYDCQADPHEVDNLAAQPAHRAKLEELRAAHEQWKKDYPDLGLLPEDQLKERMRPGGVWSIAAIPVIEKRGSTLAISCPTPGASIAYTTEVGPQPRWLLYSKPITVAAGSTVRAKACRLGWRDSQETTLQV